MNLMEAKNISKNFVTEFGLNVELLEDISFELREKEIIVFLAPKGSGKSVLLKIAARFLNADKGKLTVYSPPVFIPSRPNSFPWLSVEKNLLFANPFLAKKEIEEILEFVGLEGYANHYPHNESTGFRFRISLARALSLKPKTIILDETFAEVRHDVKKELFDLILKTKEEKNISFLIATSSITEAIYLGDKIIQLSKNPGKIINEINVSELRGKNNFESEIKNAVEKKFKEHFKNNIFDFSM